MTEKHKDIFTMKQSEFIIWKVETMESIKQKHPEITSEEDVRKMLKKIALEIMEKVPDFFGEFGDEFLNEDSTKED